MKTLQYIFLLMCCFIGSNAWAINAGNESTLTMRIINHTNSTLNFSGISNMHPGNTFHLNISEILPGGSTTLVATTSALYGITAELYFSDQQGNKNILKIVDPNQLDSKLYSQFTMNNNRFVSFVKNQKLNTNTDPRSLAWTTATIEIENKLDNIAV